MSASVIADRKFLFFNTASLADKQGYLLLNGQACELISYAKENYISAESWAIYIPKSFCERIPDLEQRINPTEQRVKRYSNGDMLLVVNKSIEETGQANLKNMKSLLYEISFPGMSVHENAELVYDYELGRSKTMPYHRGVENRAEIEFLQNQG